MIKLYQLRASNNNPYSESKIRTGNCLPDYPRKPFASKDKTCKWVGNIYQFLQQPAPQ